MLPEFKSFLTRTNALALAIGVIIGAATTQLVSAVANDVLMPIIGILLPGGGWREARLVLTSSTDAAGKVTENAILYGHLLGAVLDFVIIAAVVFAITKALMRPSPVEPKKVCSECLESIPAAAKRCRACGSPQA